MSHDSTRIDFTPLTESVTGPVFTPGQEGYEEELTGFQAGYRHAPAAVLGAANAEDVRLAVAFAAGHGIPVSVQATGHGVTVLDDGGLVINTRRLTGVTVDPQARTARIEAGARWEQVVERTAPHGLAPLSGSAGHVGVVGYTLAGGLGLLAREFGYAADLVEAVEVVTADGQARRVTADSDPDLFWALRGGRDNFGIVTALEISLLPVATVYGGGMYFDAAQADQVLAQFRSWTATAPESVTASLGMIEYPPIPVFPEPLRGRHVVHVRFATTELAAGPELVAPWREFGAEIIHEHLGELAYPEVGSIYAEPTFSHAYDGNSVLLSELTPEVLEAVRTLAGPGSPVDCIVDLRHMGGALARQPEVPNSVPFREAAYILRVLSGSDEAPLAEIRAAHAALDEAVKPWTLGRSLNFVYGERTADAFAGELYDPATRARLAKLKGVYDPANLFRTNLNIEPAA
ncbi:FAD-binding oxidoreductase [Streptomyces sp. NBC_00536]|uniref:FAD-binding oxidoreductase n=1 Tax=Streptomyces sp. NBC_00536 TaxID=2975769 RepID=UPI002E80EA7F|nr:FAD-binding oxidoreductase [Streptomyces sp. NBC_00536]WUC80862.1 FAD-binding oxidoreductase [Streptomyces sp. NBC_00536]